MLKVLSTGLLAVALIGCVDARKSFDDYGAHVVDGNTSLPDHPTVDKIPDATGHFLMGVHIAAAPTSPPILLVADFTVTDNGDGTGMVSYTASALDVTTHQIAAAGNEFGASNMPVAHDGTFTAALAGTLPGNANPISGSQVDVMAVQHGVIMSKDLICGTLTGTALVDLSGSTFAGIRIAPGTLGADLPPPVVACP